MNHFQRWERQSRRTVKSNGAGERSAATDATHDGRTFVLHPRVYNQVAQRPLLVHACPAPPPLTLNSGVVADLHWIPLFSVSLVDLTMMLSIRFSRSLAAHRLLPSTCDSAARSLAKDHTTGPGLPVAGVASEERETKTGDRLYEGGWAGEGTASGSAQGIVCTAGQHLVGSTMLPGCSRLMHCEGLQAGACPHQPAGDRVEDAPRAKLIKPDQEQPAAQDIDQGEQSADGVQLFCSASGCMTRCRGPPLIAQERSGHPAIAPPHSAARAAAACRHRVGAGAHAHEPGQGGHRRC